MKYMDILQFYMIIAIISLVIALIAYILSKSRKIYTGLLLFIYIVLNFIFIFMWDAIPDSNSDLAIFIINIIFESTFLVAFLFESDDNRRSLYIIGFSVIGYIICVLAAGTMGFGNTLSWWIFFPPILSALMGIGIYRAVPWVGITVITISIGSIVWMAYQSDVFIQSASILLLISSVGLTIRVNKKNKNVEPQKECLIYCDESETECCDV